MKLPPLFFGMLAGLACLCVPTSTGCTAAQRAAYLNGFLGSTRPASGPVDEQAADVAGRLTRGGAESAAVGSPIPLIREALAVLVTLAGTFGASRVQRARRLAKVRSGERDDRRTRALRPPPLEPIDPESSAASIVERRRAA